MSIIGDLLEQASSSQVDDKSLDWLTKGIDKIESDLIPGIEDPDEKELALQGVAFLRDASPALAGLSKEVALNVLSFMGSHQTDKAQESYLRKEADFDTLMKNLAKVDDAVVAGTEARLAQWEELKEIGKKALPVLAKAVLMLLAA